MQWSKVKSGQITIYEMGKNQTVPLKLKYGANRLFCGEDEIPVLTEDQTMYWKQQANKGSLVSIYDTRLLKGTLVDAEGAHFIKASIDSKISLVFFGNAETKTYDLIFGSRQEREDVIDFISLREPDKEVDLGYGFVFEQEDEGVCHTHIRCSILPVTDAYIGFGFLDVFFDDSYTEVNGKAWENEDVCRKTEPVYMVHGTYIGDDSFLQYESSADKKILQLEEGEKAELRKYNQTLCVEELFSLPMPVIEDVNADYPEALYDLMRYVISEEQLKYIGNPGRPSYSGAKKEQIDALVQDENVKQFLTEDYYYAYISQMLASNPSMTYASYITNIKNYDKKLNGYFNDSLKTSMNAHKGYQKISETLYPQLYFKNSPLICAYLGEKKTGR